MATDLVFGQTGTVTTALVFGAENAVAPINITLAGVFPPLGFSSLVNVAPVADVLIDGSYAPLALDSAVALTANVTLEAAFPSLTLSAAAEYISNVDRPTVAQVTSSASIAAPIEGGFTQPEGITLSSLAGVAAPFSEATQGGKNAGMPFTESSRYFSVVQAKATEAQNIGARTSSQFQNGDASCRHTHKGRFQDGVRAFNPPISTRFQDGLKDRRHSHTDYCQNGAATQITRNTRFRYACPHYTYKYSRFQDAWVPRPGQYVPPVIPPVQPEYWGTALVFMGPPLSIPNLVFGPTQCSAAPTPSALYYILPAKVYMTAHTIYAQRLSDLADVPIFEATVSADSGSYCWTLSASGPQSLFTQLAPVDGLPVQLRINLDGIPWVFAVDALSRTSAFGKTGVSITGRSVTALIGAPYLRATTRTNTEPRLAQQLALDALTYSGVALDWGLIDWMVPTAAWSHQGTPLDAVQVIAQAAGGYLQSHRSAPTLLARHPYSQRAGDNPGAPWGWMTGPADVEMAPDAIITEGLERKDGPDINAVYVSGTTQGVLAQVKRTGSAADKLATMVTDALITDAIAARQRGLAILGAAGPQYGVRLELPVLTGAGQPGVLDVGQLVQINTAHPWRGRVRAVSVHAKRPSIQQSVTLERHLETV